MKRRDFIVTCTALGILTLWPKKSAFALPTIISSFPATITAPGSYTITQNWDLVLPSGAAISVESDDVEIDLAGFRISNSLAGDTNRAAGVLVQTQNRVTIKNGTIEGMHTGIVLGSHQWTTGHLIEQIQIKSCYAAGMLLAGTASIIRNNQIVTPQRSSVISVGGCSGFMGIGVRESQGLLIQGNTIALNDSGEADGTVGMFFAPGCVNVVALNNQISNADLGIVVDRQFASGNYRGNVTSQVSRPYLGNENLSNTSS